MFCFDEKMLEIENLAANIYWRWVNKPVLEKMVKYFCKENIVLNFDIKLSEEKKETHHLKYQNKS